MRIFNRLKISFKKGSMMIEVVVVASIVTALVLSASAVAQKSISLSRQSTHQAQASFLLDEGVEATRIIRDNAWSGISNLTIGTDYYLSFSGGTWTLTTTPNTIGIFSRKISFSSVYRDVNDDIVASGTIDDQTRFVAVTVSWLEGGETISKVLQFYVADIFSE